MAHSPKHDNRPDFEKLQSTLNFFCVENFLVKNFWENYSVGWLLWLADHPPPALGLDIEFDLG